MQEAYIGRCSTVQYFTVLYHLGGHGARGRLWRLPDRDCSVLGVGQLGRCQRRSTYRVAKNVGRLGLDWFGGANRVGPVRPGSLY